MQIDAPSGRADTDRGAVHLRIRLPVPRDVVWTALTDPAHTTAWLDADAGSVLEGGDLTCSGFWTGYDTLVEQYRSWSRAPGSALPLAAAAPAVVRR